MSLQFKSILKNFLPLVIRQRAMRLAYKINGFDEKFGGYDTEKIFDFIYEKGIWGKDAEGLSISGSGSHKSEILEPYVESVKSLLQEKKFSTIVDLGCGDFNVGLNFLSYCKKYIACDVSNTVLQQNKKKFFDEHLEFKKIDIAKDPLPEGDVAFVREVLQHLSNLEIKKFVNNLNNNKPFRYLVVTESLNTDSTFIPNLDKKTGPDTRNALGSGIELHKEPFNLEHKSLSILCEVKVLVGVLDGVIRTTLYEI
jgi:hypothetical protein